MSAPSLKSAFCRGSVGKSTSVLLPGCLLVFWCGTEGPESLFGVVSDLSTAVLSACAFTHSFFDDKRLIKISIK